MPQSAKTEVHFEGNSEVHEIRLHQDDDHAKCTTELNNENGFSPIYYEENDFSTRDLFYENNLQAGYKRESDHR